MQNARRMTTFLRVILRQMAKAGEEDDLFEEQEAKPVHWQRIPCPKCGSYDFRRSNTESLRVTINQIFGRWPFRCRNCRALFFRHAPPPPE
jgi:transposase-like protein